MIVKCCCLLQFTHAIDLTKKETMTVMSNEFLTIKLYEYVTIHVCILVHIDESHLTFSLYNVHLTAYA